VESDDARRGTAIHAYLQALADGTPREDALAATPEDVRAWCEKIAPGVVPTGGETEVALVYDCASDTASRRTVAGHRQYGELAPGQVPGTADLVLWDERPLRVIDWKTTAYDLDAQAAKPQLEFLALAAARVAGMDSAVAEVRVLREDGACFIAASWALGWEDLDRVASEVERDLGRVGREQLERARLGAAYTPDVVRGSWCTYCPAWDHCPAQTAAVRRFRAADLAPPADALGEAYLDACAAERAAEALRAVAREHIRNHGAVRAGDKTLTLDARGSLRLR
jgi:hypothetical protein